MAPDISIRDISLEENGQLFDQLVLGFGKISLSLTSRRCHPVVLNSPVFLLLL
jgi:hypothetical protein